MSSRIGPQKLLEIVLKACGLYSPPVYSLPSQAASQTFPIASRTDINKAKKIMSDKPRIPYSGLAGYSERGEPEDWDTAMGEVYGYRWWYLPLPPETAGFIDCPPRIQAPGRNIGVLSGAYNQEWEDGRMEAGCRAYRYNMGFSFDSSPRLSEHRPPETREACGCGFWAYFNRGLQVDDVLSFVGGTTPKLFSWAAAVPVFGVIKGTGRVIIGEKGFRSQYAQIMGLCLPEIAVAQLRWHMPPPPPFNLFNYSAATPGLEKCSEAELITRVSEIECMLSERYPSAKMFTSQELLTRYFPPDKNYS